MSGKCSLWRWRQGIPRARITILVSSELDFEVLSHWITRKRHGGLFPTATTSLHMHKQQSAHVPTHVNMHPQTCMHTYMQPRTRKWKNKHSSTTTSETMVSFSSTSCKAYRTHPSSLSDLHTTSLFCFNSAEVSLLLTKGDLAPCQLRISVPASQSALLPQASWHSSRHPLKQAALTPRFTSILFVFLSPRIGHRLFFFCCWFIVSLFSGWLKSSNSSNKFLPGI